MNRTTRSASSRRLLAALAAAVIACAGLVSAPAAVADPAGDTPSYVALGDSYSSGVGAGTYLADSGACRRSSLAWPALLAARSGATLTFAACGGATVPDVVATQLSALNADTDVVTLSIGGNDAGFSPVLGACLPTGPTDTCLQASRGARRFAIEKLPTLLHDLYRQIRERAPYARVTVVGYPRLFNGVQCPAVAGIEPMEQWSLNITGEVLNAIVAWQAWSAGFRYLSARPAFEGHAVCDGVPYLNGLVASPGDSFHPNPAGYAAYADVIGGLG